MVVGYGSRRPKGDVTMGCIGPYIGKRTNGWGGGPVGDGAIDNKGVFGGASYVLRGYGEEGHMY